MREVVLKEVMVTITETKTGVPGEFSREPSCGLSLKGIGDDGKVYEKHWESWPESQTNCFTGEWSLRDDGDKSVDHGFWSPKEAVYVWDKVLRHNTKYPDKKVTLIKEGFTPIPKGHVTYCSTHDHYQHPDQPCHFCIMEMMQKEKELKAPPTPEPVATTT
ncbi:MAG: hypothetical protein WCW14_01035 [Candidatus Paceibacterota bacterium]|jgi:hypothetical protein